MIQHVNVYIYLGEKYVNDKVENQVFYAILMVACSIHYYRWEE